MSLRIGETLLKSDLAKILDEKIRLVGGWATVYIKDRQGDIVPIEEILKGLYTLANSVGQIPLLFEHQNKPVGKVIRWEKRIHPETGKEGIWIEAVIFKDHPLADRVWEMIKNGKLKGFSIAGEGHRVEQLEGDEIVKVVRDISLYEISVVHEPANPEAKLEFVNQIAKSDDCPKGRYTDGEKWKPMTCPGDASGKHRPICGCIRYFMNCVYEGDLIRAVKKCLDLFSNDKDKKTETAKAIQGVSCMTPEDVSAKVPEKQEEVVVVTGEGQDSMVIGYEDMSKVFGTTEVEKADDCKAKYFVCTKKEGSQCKQGHFKNMKCPDGYGPNRFCGCVNYFKECRGESLETAKKICYKICVDKYGEDYCSGRHGKYVKKSDGEEPVEKAEEENKDENVKDGGEILKLMDELRATISKLAETVTELSQRITSIEKKLEETEDHGEVEGKPIDPVGQEPGSPVEIEKTEQDEQEEVKKTNEEQPRAQEPAQQSVQEQPQGEKVEIGAKPKPQVITPEMAKMVLEGKATAEEVYQKMGVQTTVAFTPPAPMVSVPRKEIPPDDIKAILEGKKRAIHVLYQ